MLTFLSLFCVVVVLIYLYLMKDKNYWRKRNVVQVDGALLKFIFGNRSLSELYKELYDQYADEKYIGIFIGSRPAVLLKDVNDITTVLQGDFQNFHSRGIVTNPKDILADNLLFMNNYRRWRLIRQKLSPVFTHMKLKNMFYIMERCARDFVEFIENNEQLRKKPFNAHYTYTTASIGASVFGIDTQTQNTMQSPFMDMAWKIFEPSFRNNMRFTLSSYFPRLFKLLNIKTFAEHEKFFVGVMKRVLESRRSEKNVRHDFIDTCLELQQDGTMHDSTTGYEIEPTDEILAAQAFFFFIAGADPSATAMNFALLELSYNPSILKRLHNEIDSVFESCKGTLTYEALEKMVYLDAVINETLRKYPPVGIMQRVCTKKSVLPSGLELEPDTIVVIPVFALHRDENYFPNPDNFDPKRFAPENGLSFVKCTNLPFGAGNRICIGARFARLQIKAGLATLLHRFTLRNQPVKTPNFERSFFSLRDATAAYELILREHC